jgi:hypothetical protein
VARSITSSNGLASRKKPGSAWSRSWTTCTRSRGRAHGPRARGVVHASSTRPRDEASPAHDRDRRHVPQPPPSKAVPRSTPSRAVGRPEIGAAWNEEGISTASTSHRSASEWTDSTRRSRSSARYSQGPAELRGQHYRVHEVLNAAAGPARRAEDPRRRRWAANAPDRDERGHDPLVRARSQTLRHKKEVLEGCCETLGRDPRRSS